MNIIFIGCVRSSYVFFQRVCLLPDVKIVGVITRRHSSFNADFYSLEQLAKEMEIPCLLAELSNAEEMDVWCRERGADVIYGWSHLLPQSILRICPLGVIGYHPAALPANRGRHPIIWALALGLEETASTFFFMDEKADHGDILSQEKIVIEETDDASSLYDKLLTVAVEQILKITHDLVHRNYCRIPQNHAKGNCWRKRNFEDGKIDWRMPARGIYNLVRALTVPYAGAHFIYQGKIIKVWRARIVSEASVYKNLEPGLILETGGEGVCVQCGMGIIQLLSCDFKGDFLKGEYLR